MAFPFSVGGPPPSNYEDNDYEGEDSGDNVAESNPLLEEIRRLRESDEQKNKQFLNLLNESSRTQEILREQLAHTAQIPQPAQQQQQDWYKVNLPSVETQSSTQQQQNGPLTSEQIRQIAAQAAVDALRLQAEREAKQRNDYNSRVAALREKHQRENAHIASNPQLQGMFVNRLNRYHQLNPGLPPEQLYNMALEDMQTEIGSIAPIAPPEPRRGPGRPPNQARTSEPSTRSATALQSYNMPQGATAAKPTVERGMENMSPEDRRKASFVQRQKQFQDTLKKTRR